MKKPKMKPRPAPLSKDDREGLLNRVSWALKQTDHELAICAAAETRRYQSLERQRRDLLQIRNDLRNMVVPSKAAMAILQSVEFPPDWCPF